MFTESKLRFPGEGIFDMDNEFRMETNNVNGMEISEKLRRKRA